MQEWGSDLVKENTLNSATVKYTNFLLATASGKIEGVKGLGKLATPFEKTIVAAYTLGAMTPCMRLYAFLGKELQSLLDTNESNHLYIKWINNYSSKDFEVCSSLRLRHCYFIFVCSTDTLHNGLLYSGKLNYLFLCILGISAANRGLAG